MKNSVVNLSIKQELESQTFECPLKAQCLAQPSVTRRKVRSPNWLLIVKCRTLWALIGINFAHNWYTKAKTLWPTYFTSMLHLDAETIGLIIGIKGLVGFIYGCFFAYLTRNLALSRPFNLKLTNYRKLCFSLATLLVCISISLMVTFDCNLLLNIVAILIDPLADAFNLVSLHQIPLDLSPEDSGVLAAYVRLLAVGDIVALPVSSYVLSYAAPQSSAGNRTTWQIVWLLNLIINLVACLVFVVFAKAEPKSYSRVEGSSFPCVCQQQSANHFQQE